LGVIAEGHSHAINNRIDSQFGYRKGQRLWL